MSGLDDRTCGDILLSSSVESGWIAYSGASALLLPKASLHCTALHFRSMPCTRSLILSASSVENLLQTSYVTLLPHTECAKVAKDEHGDTVNSLARCHSGKGSEFCWLRRVDRELHTPRDLH